MIFTTDVLTGLISRSVHQQRHLHQAGTIGVPPTGLIDKFCCSLRKASHFIVLARRSGTSSPSVGEGAVSGLDSITNCSPLEVELVSPPTLQVIVGTKPVLAMLGATKQAQLIPSLWILDKSLPIRQNGGNKEVIFLAHDIENASTSRAPGSGFQLQYTGSW